jgi:membrane-associated phospholipid phosphatase|tara:strand:- start:856 stop:1431 length:576 start_codon:yes stop_codon:yes gene_type:complete
MDSIYNQMLFLAAPKIYFPLFSFLFLMAVFFPLLTVYIMYKNKLISSIAIPKRKERLPVLALVIIYYSMTYYIFRYWNTTLLNLLQPYLSFLFAGLILLLLLTLITLKWKISIHAASIAGLTGGITALTLIAHPIINLQQIFLINALLLTFIGLVSFSRMYLKAHSMIQILVGISLGFSLVFILVFNQFYI